LREWMAYDAVDRTGIVALINPELAKRQVEEYGQVVKSRNDAVARGNQSLFDLIEGDHRRYRDLWRKQEEERQQVVSQLAPNIVKSPTSSSKGKATKENRPIVFNSIEDVL